MRGNLFALGLVIAIMAVSAGAASAAPPGIPRPAPPMIGPPLETLGGHLDMYTRDQSIVVALSAAGAGAVDRQFTIEVSGAAGLLPSSFHSDAARIVSWKGHLLVTAEGRAFLFSVAGYPQDLPNEGDVPDLSSLARQADSLLTSHYNVTRIGGATAIISNSPAGASSLAVPLGAVPGASFLMDCCDTDSGCCLDYQNYGSGGSSCAAWCSISCQDGTTCSATCGTSRCARCSCPASCSCS
jgi:hypothetical protein